MIILLGETVEAREINENLNKRGLKLIRLKTWSGKGCPQMPDLVIDASHPSVSVKFTQLRQWCTHKGTPYLRLQRPETRIPVSPLIFPVSDWEEVLIRLEQRVAALLREKRRIVTIFITTGRYQLESIMASTYFRSVRLVVRILPEVQVVKKCKEMGIHSRDIIAMQGPFSKEVNKGLFKFYGTDILLTRDSGYAGGTDSKISAALELGVEIVLLKRAKDKSSLLMNTTSELLAWVDNNILGKDISLKQEYFYFKN